MNLQSLLFPQNGICCEETLYFRRNEAFVCFDNDCLRFRQGGTAQFDTYFNSFSIAKWSKHTCLVKLGVELVLQGSFRVTLVYNERTANGFVEKKMGTFHVTSENRQIFKFAFDSLEANGICYFKLESTMENSQYYGGMYYSAIDESELQPVQLSVNICTFKREEYVYRNIARLKHDILDNPQSPLFGHLQVYIVDNGASLDHSALHNDSIHIFDNKNVGGAGGFTRGLIEILSDKSKYNTTHVLLMDDDAIFESDSLVRTYQFLRLLKEKYRALSIGGTMLRSDKPYMQHGAAATWNFGAGSQVPFRRNVDVRVVNNLVANEIEQPTDYICWWYCCMPIKLISLDQLPLPVFIHGDDVEYSLRCCRGIIVMNGICVWHEPFEFRYGSHEEYYDVRNTFITNAFHAPRFDAKQAKKFLFKKMLRHLLSYRYRYADLNFRAVEDFLKGVDWLKYQNPSALHRQILNAGYNLKSEDQLQLKFRYTSYAHSLKCSESKAKLLLRRVSLNGWLLPANKLATVPTANPLLFNFYRARKVLNFDIRTGRGYVTKKSYWEVCRIIRGYCKACRLIDKNYSNCAEEYRSRKDELTCLKFWENYLGIKARIQSDKSSTDSNKSLTECQKTSKLEEKAKKLLGKLPPLYRMIQCIVHPPKWSILSDIPNHLRIVERCTLKLLGLDKLNRQMRDIQKIKDRHKGHRCFITCTGPSLTVEDLNKICGEYSIGVNTIFLMFSKTTWRPTYYAMIDYYAFLRLRSDYLMNFGDYAQQEVFLNSNIRPQNPSGKERYCLINYGNHSKHRMKHDIVRVGTDPSVCIYDCFTVTNMAIDLAIYMGFTEIYIIGADCDYSTTQQHCVELTIDKERQGQKWLLNAVELSIKGYEANRLFAERMGVKIYNATRGGKLEVFERVCLDDVINKK